jgi:cytochrome c-type biogenesis protein CcmH
MAAGIALLAVAIRGPDSPRTIDQRVEAVAATLRCPVCQNLSVADSPSRLAAEIRRQIGRDLRAGRTPDQIRARFAAAYGEWILQAPSKEGVGLVAWLAPAVLLLGGAVAAGMAVRGWAGRSRPRKGRTPDLSPSDRAMLERALSEEDQA